MNYFGHAAVSTWSSASPGTALGAMLPDFATMSRTRLANAEDHHIDLGIDLHHRTDAAFHHLPPVLALMRELDAHLETAGCTRGPRRAVAHIGVELLLDGVLVAERAYRDAYVAALSHDPAGIRWREPADGDRFGLLLARLRTYGVPDDLREPAAIARRLHRMLAHRPLLAPSASDLAAIESSLAAHRPRVEAATETVLRALRAAMF